MDVKNSSRRSGRFWSRQRTKRVIAEFELGPILDDDPVVVAATGAVAGDIYASKVTISGLVVGHVVALELVISPTGRLWGDAYTRKLSFEPGAVQRGWTHSIDEDEYQRLRALDRRPLQPATLSPEFADTIPSDLEQAVSELRASMPSDRADILALLRDEAAMALLARAEIEARFDQRIDELSGSNIRESERLRERIGLLSDEHAQTQQRIADVQNRLQSRESELATREVELASLQKELEEKIAAYEQISTSLATHREQLQTQTTESERLDSALKNSLQHGEALEERLGNLEIALQSSIQRTAEQEEALLRWQELAETNEMRARELEDELRNARHSADETTKMLDILRAQRQQLEQEWEQYYQQVQELQTELAENRRQSDRRDQELALIPQLKAQIESLQNKTQRLAEFDEAVAANQALQVQVDEFEIELSRRQKELAISKQALVESTAATGQANQRIAQLEREIERVRAQTVDDSKWRKQLRDLQTKLRMTEKQAADLPKLQATYDLLLSEHKALQSRVTQINATIGNKESDFNTAQQQLLIEQEAARQALDALSTAQQRIKALEEKLSAALESEMQQREAYQLKIKDLDEQMQQRFLAMREQERLVNDHESDLAEYERQVSTQGDALAELRTELVERDLHVQQLKESLGKYQREVQRIKRLAGAHIKKVEDELKRTKGRLTEAMQVIERRKK